MTATLPAIDYVKLVNDTVNALYYENFNEDFSTDVISEQGDFTVILSLYGSIESYGRLSMEHLRCYVKIFRLTVEDENSREVDHDIDVKELENLIKRRIEI